MTDQQILAMIKGILEIGGDECFEKTMKEDPGSIHHEIANMIAVARDHIAKANPHPPRWSDDQCFALNAHQHRGDIHPYTCGNDSRHRPLIATPRGWKCVDCDYTQPIRNEMEIIPS